MSLKVDKYLRKKSEENNDLTLPPGYRTEKAIVVAEKLAINEKNGKQILDEIWEEYGSFQAFHHYHFWNNFVGKLENQLISTNGSCLPSCNSTMERHMRSLYALFKVKRTFPSSTGLYLAYHFNKIFGKDSYLGFSEPWTRHYYNEGTVS